MKFLTPLAAGALLFFASCDNVDGVNTVYSPEEQAEIAAEFSATFVDVPKYTNAEGLPAHFARFGFGTQSKTEDAKIHLGRALFYDVRLSEDLSVSCASCHQQDHGFADTEALSTGISGRATARNSQSINNIRAYYGDTGSGFFWDSRAQSLEHQAEETMANENEMGMSLSEVRERLEQVPAYSALFRAAFNGDATPRNRHITEALAAFTRNISSTGSEFDKALDAHLRSEGNENRFGFGNELVTPAFAEFNDSQNRGKELYLQNCSSCHSSQLPTRLEPANNGLYVTGGYEDKGVGALRPGKDGWFKTPQLRNVAMTGPYMHNGSIETLEEVIEHYSSGINNHNDLSPEFRTLRDMGNGKVGFGFSDRDKDDLLAFLHTLTDNELAANENLANPFQ